MEDKKDKQKVKEPSGPRGGEVGKASEVRKKEIAEQPKVEEKKEKLDDKKTEKKEQIKKFEKKSDKKPEKKKVKGKEKTEAVVYGRNLKISTKYAIAICNMIRNKKIERAIGLLGEVLQFKRAVPMKGEIPHRKGKIMSGRFPQKASLEIFKLLKQLMANAQVNELEIEEYIIFCKADKATRPYRRFGRGRFKRTNLLLKLVKPVKEKK